MTRDEIITKGSDLMTPILGAARVRNYPTVFGWEAVSDVRQLRPLLRAVETTGKKERYP